MKHMASKRTSTSTVPETFEEAVERIEQRDNERYPSGWDYYDNMVSDSPDGTMCIPHGITGESIGVDLFEDTFEEIAKKCAIPEDRQGAALVLCRDYLLRRMPYWNKNEIPARIPLLEE